MSVCVDLEHHVGQWMSRVNVTVNVKSECHTECHEWMSVCVDLEHHMWDSECYSECQEWMSEWMLHWMSEWMCVCVDLEHHLSQLDDIRVPAGCVFSLDHAKERGSLSPIFSGCRDLCRVSVDSAVYLWFRLDQWGAAGQFAGQWLSAGWDRHRQVWISSHCSGCQGTNVVLIHCSVLQCHTNISSPVIALGVKVQTLFSFIAVFYNVTLMLTQRRSIAKSFGCFHRRLFVCVFVNTITAERVNIGWWNLGVGALYKNLDRVQIWGS